MKKILLLIFLTTATLLASAQKGLRLNGYAGYVFDDGYNNYYNPENYYDGQVDGGFQWGVGVEYLLSPRGCLELMYLHRSTHAPTTIQTGLPSTNKTINFDLNHDYILLGGDGHMPTAGGVVEGYAGIFGGILIANLDNPETGDEASSTRFAWAIRLGCNIWPGEGRVGIKLQSQLISSIRAAGGSFYFDPYGNPIGLSAYSTLYQFGLGGGLTVKIGK